MKKKYNDKYNSNAEFSHDVVNLYKYLIGATEQNPSPLANRDVERCASGLRLLRILLDEYSKSLNTSKAYPHTGVIDAYGILDHLVTGRSHPVARHIDGIHSRVFRANVAPAGELEQFQQAVVVSLINIIITEEKVTRNKAATLIVEHFKRHNFGFTVDQLISWDRKFKNEDNKLPIFLAHEFLRRSEIINKDAAAIGFEEVENIWSVTAEIE
jgi:hypothetical protein